jgi:restriction system protein
MTIPSEREIWQPLLEVLYTRGGHSTLKALLPDLEQRFEDLTDADKMERVSSGEPKWKNRVQFARQRLVQQGCIDRSERGVWRLTPAGVLRAQNDAPTAPPLEPTLASSPSIKKLRTAAAAAKATVIRQLDLYEETHRELMLARLNELSDRQFERITGQVLAAHGLEDLEVGRGSHDNGIDGTGTVVMGIMRHGVAYQCKRLSTNIQRPEIDKFRGAIEGGYDQGFFVTTGKFSLGAREASTRRGTVRIVLIDGAELVRKMFSKNIGVTRIRDVHLFDQTGAFSEID